MSLTERLEQALDYQQNYETKVREAATYLNDEYLGFIFKDKRPQFGIVLGSGLNDLAAVIKKEAVIPYKDIPNFPVPTVEGHEGNFIIGQLEGVPVIGLQGRKHYYEVADQPFNTGILQVIFPVHVLAELSVPNYFVTNAAGGLNQEYNVGDIMIIKSHINMMPSPLLGREHDFKTIKGEKLQRFQPMNGAYDADLRKMLRNATILSGNYPKKGTYLAVTGPTYETEGECIAFRDGLHADAVGMSTTPEVIVAKNRGMNVVGFSCITNKIAKDGTNATNHEEVKAVLESEETRKLLTGTVKNFFGLYKEKTDGLFDVECV
ncbi:purine-nucleoside phosphorylase [Candidatus Woesearchaeota archaeon]|nr:purine-nucleoside phosphorylase [Candidatus Woesearchaeota archaeon]